MLKHIILSIIAITINCNQLNSGKKQISAMLAEPLFDYEEEFIDYQNGMRVSLEKAFVQYAQDKRSALTSINGRGIVIAMFSIFPNGSFSNPTILSTCDDTATETMLRQTFNITRDTSGGFSRFPDDIAEKLWPALNNELLVVLEAQIINSTIESRISFHHPLPSKEPFYVYLSKSMASS